MPIFVIHKHKARQLHWDLRLEMDGILRSWAVPKTPPQKSGIKRLALQVEDHEMSYADFEGEIPDNEYGAGTVEIWDTGKCTFLEEHKDRLKFTLRGKRLKGTYILFRFSRAGTNAWLFFKASRAHPT